MDIHEPNQTQTQAHRFESHVYLVKTSAAENQLPKEGHIIQSHSLRIHSVQQFTDNPVLGLQTGSDTSEAKVTTSFLLLCNLSDANALPHYM